MPMRVNINHSNFKVFITFPGVKVLSNVGMCIVATPFTKVTIYFELKFPSQRWPIFYEIQLFSFRTNVLSNIGIKYHCFRVENS
jgi:hypothetical protein